VWGGGLHKIVATMWALGWDCTEVCKIMETTMTMMMITELYTV